MESFERKYVPKRREEFHDGGRRGRTRILTKKLILLFEELLSQSVQDEKIVEEPTDPHELKRKRRSKKKG
ncbi:MAG TPA: hypothetical protein VJI32_02190 [Candidatus Nanoarchaeia archaeon]|nr:hypothetical protein [Candidatus Nanoarchaeia archaeon]